LGLFDLLSGLGLSFPIFYLPTIYWLTCRYGLLPGIFVSVLAAFVLLPAEILGGQSRRGNSWEAFRPITSRDLSP